MGRRSNKDVNKIRASVGRKLIPEKKRKSTAILPNEKKKRHQEVLAGMLNSKGKAVVQKVLDKALTDGDDDQMTCLKIVMDRIIPADYISKAKSQGNAIQINITGVDEAIIEREPIDAEFKEENG
mgnify:CR=1 FL=1